MSFIQIILAIWLAGWLISVGVYVRGCMKRAREAGGTWSLKENLVPTSALLLTWFPSFLLYVYLRVKLRSEGS
ncbi:MAG TPA: hypothetical protein DCZ69_02840 [Syntrophobacteraceae bacterium]|jgi:hypothetical protein|nr:hypothetical protein [Syntrophobacteraceae bacterium]HBZ56437.1 hypothetical protein [Syntrophobacteraceae bacterium]